MNVTPSGVVRIVVSDRLHAAAFPGHPGTYEVTEPEEVRELLTAAVDGPAGERDDFVCMCRGEFGLVSYDAAGGPVRTVDRHGPLPLLDPALPQSIPARHRAAWAAAAPGPLRGYAEGWARGDPPAPGTVTVPPGPVLRWLGTPPGGTLDAARDVARLAPLALLDAVATDELARAVRTADAAGLDGAVEFFASEHFTARHPKKRRVGATARELLLRHARTRRPGHAAVLERRVLLAAEDRIRR
ncbi:hypothetical protein ABZ508_27690 [Streptomyces lavendulocolor]|uniref:Uncharacterized protein n=1 Tax=Streptomyces lavendulocolor TaxID=67316 RepID=A0ABV2WCT5_9ACTN